MATALSRQFKNIYVLSRFHYEKYQEFIQAIIVLSRVIADKKLHLIYGGDNQGLSKVVSEVIFIKGSQVPSIISKALKPLKCFPSPLTGKELVFPSMQERIFEMLNHADSFIFLVGDLATIEVLITFVSWAHLNIHKKLIGLLNVDNFYDGLIAFFNHTIKSHFNS